MTISTFPLPSATHSSTPSRTRPFLPTPGTYEAVIAAAASVYALEDLVAALADDAQALSLLTQRLEAARDHLETAKAAHLAGFPC